MQATQVEHKPARGFQPFYDLILQDGNWPFKLKCVLLYILTRLLNLSVTMIVFEKGIIETAPQQKKSINYHHQSIG